MVEGELAFRQEAWTHVDRLREKGATFLVSSDSPKQFRRFCDRALYIADGRLVADTSVPEALAAMRAARQAAREAEGGASGE